MIVAMSRPTSEIVVADRASSRPSAPLAPSTAVIPPAATSQVASTSKAILPGSRRVERRSRSVGGRPSSSQRMPRYARRATRSVTIPATTK